MLKGRKLSEIYLYLAIVVFVSIVMSFLALVLESYLMKLVSFVAMIAEVVLVFKLGDYSDYFIKACILNFITGLISLVPFTIVIVGMIIKLVAAYYMFKGHSEILTGIDDTLAVKWKKLFVWYKIPAVIMVVVGIVMVVVLFIEPFVVVLFILLAKYEIVAFDRVVTIYLLAFRGLEIYYLHKTHLVLGKY